MSFLQDRRPRRRRHQVRRHHAPRRQDGLPRRRPPRHRGVRQLEGRTRSRRSPRWSPARKHARQHLNAIIDACHDASRGRRRATTRFDPKKNAGAASRDPRGPRRPWSPRTTSQRVRAARPAGLHRDRRSRPTTPTGTARPTSRSPARTPTTPCASPTSSSKAVDERRRLGPDPPHRRHGRASTVKARELWDQIAYAAWACADPGVQFDTTINEWHTCPADGRINALEPVLRVHVPRRHGLQPGLAEPVTFLDATTASFDVEAFEHAVRLWTIVLEISVLMAQFPSQAIAQLLLRVPHARPRLRQPRRAADGRRHPLRLATRAARWPARITAILTGVSYATSAEMAGELGAFAGYDAQPRAHAARHRATTAAPPTTRRATSYEGLTDHAGGARPRDTARNRASSRPRDGLGPGARRSARSTATATPRSR